MRLFRKAGKENGQAMVEMAVVLPVLLLLLCGIIDMAWLGYNKLSLSYCSREAARYGIVHAEDSGAVEETIDRAKQVAPDIIRDNISVTVSYTNTSSPSLGDICVNVSMTAQGLTPIIGSICADGIELSAQCVMKVE